MAHIYPVVTCIPHSGVPTGLQSGSNFLVTFLYSPVYAPWEAGAPSLEPFLLAAALYHTDPGGGQPTWLWWGQDPDNPGPDGWQSGQLAWQYTDWGHATWHDGQPGGAYSNLLASTIQNLSGAQIPMSYRPTLAKADGTVYMFYRDPVQPSNLRVLKYDHAAVHWTSLTVPSYVTLADSSVLPANGVPFVVAKDSQDRIWVAWHDAANPLAIRCMREDGSGGWEESTPAVHTSDRPVLVRALAFVGSDVPVVFFVKRESDDPSAGYRLFCASDGAGGFWTDEVTVARTPPPVARPMPDSRGAFVGSWSGGSGFGVLDADGYYYQPTGDCAVEVFPPGFCGRSGRLERLGRPRQGLDHAQ